MSKALSGLNVIFWIVFLWAVAFKSCGIDDLGNTFGAASLFTAITGFVLSLKA